MKRTTIFFLSILFFGISLVDTGHTQECPIYRELIQKYMPEEVGNERVLADLLKVEPDNWMLRLNVEEIYRILNDEGLFQKGGAAPNTLAGAYEGKNSLIKFNLAKGEIRYANRSRLFTPNNPKAIDPEKGREIVLSLLSALGLNEKEVSIQKIQERILKGAAAEPKQMDPEIVLDMERTYFVPRLVNSLFVVDSITSVGVSNDGLISRFRVRWPVFNIDQRLFMAKAVSKEKMIQRVNEQMANEQGCEKILQERFAMYIAYAPVRGMDGDDKDNLQDVNRLVLFAPKLIVQYMPTSSEEGGNVLEFNLFDFD